MRATNPKTLKDFMKEFNPDTQIEICKDKQDCFFGEYPTLRELVKRYGSKAAIAWLYVQIFDLSEYCGCKEKLTEHQIEQCASIIWLKYPHLKISELMYYFVNFKAGQYGRFYGMVDPLIITTGLEDFGKERVRIYEKEEQRKKEEMLRGHKPITWEEYKRLTGRSGESPLAHILGG